MTVTCKGCKQQVDPLEEFPGHLCLTCYAEREESKPLPTAAELAAMFRSPRMFR